MTDRQAALREALEAYIEVREGHGRAKGGALARYILKRLGHCNTCGGKGTKVDIHDRTRPCPDCVPDEIELLGKMGK